MLAKAPFTGQNSFADIQIQKKVSHILIVSSGVPLSAEKINIGLTSNGSQAIILPSVKIRDAGLKSQFLNGYLSTSKQVDGTVIQEFIIELTHDGRSVDLSDSNFISVGLDNLTTGNTYSVYGIEAPNAVRRYLQTSTNSIAGAESQQRLINVTGYPHALYIRNNGGLSLLRILFDTGEECSYTPAELRAVTREVNGITEASDYMIEGDAVNQIILNGAQEMFFFPLSGVRSYEVTTVGGTDVVLFTEEVKTF